MDGQRTGRLVRGYDGAAGGGGGGGISGRAGGATTRAERSGRPTARYTIAPSTCPNRITITHTILVPVRYDASSGTPRASTSAQIQTTVPPIAIANSRRNAAG